jgi:hypothetical protein
MIAAGLITSLVVMLMLSIRPEKIMSRKIRGFFHACAEITLDFVDVVEKKRRKEHYLHEVRRVPGELRAVARTLDYSRLPANAQERVNHLLDLIDGVAARLQVVKILLDRVTTHAPSQHLTAPPLGVELPRRLHRIFERWSKITRSPVVTEEERGTITKLYQEMEERLEMYLADTGSSRYSEKMATDLTALLSGVRGLLDVMAETDRLIHDFSWDRWVEVRI